MTRRIILHQMSSKGETGENYLQIFPHVEVEEGIYEGQKMKSGITVFKGIRYAKAPEGELRWQAPQPIKPFKRVKKALKFGPACPQAKGSIHFYARAEKLAGLPEGTMSWAPEKQDEDCLYLNIWTPKISSSARLPVMVWIHGGASVFGASHNPLYDGEKIAREKGVVLISFNYRLGVFGYMAHAQLSAESESKSSGNYGLMDQIAALEWIKENIDSFGGNPYNLTIFGQSAGGRAVLNLMSSTYASGLFQKAIAQSPWDGEHHYRQLKKKVVHLDSAEDIGNKIAENLGIKNDDEVLDKLRKASPEDLIAAAKKIDKPGTVFAPFVDGYILEYHPFRIFSNGLQNKASLIIGLTANEADIFLVKKYFETADEYAGYIQSTFGPMADQFIELYPASDDDKERRTQMLNLFADRHFLTPALYAANENTKTSDTYLYYYKYVEPHFTPEALAKENTTIGAYHCGEIKMVFGKPDNNNPVEVTISETLMDYWTNFAKSGNPNGDSVPKWDTYNKTPQTYLEIDTDIKQQEKLNNKRFKLFKKLVEKMI